MTRAIKHRLQRAYLLRCWQEGELARWRFSLEEIARQRRRQGFDSLEAMFHFLQADLANGEDEPAGPEEGVG